MAGDNPDDRTLTANEPIGVSLPQSPPRRLGAPLQLRERERYEVLGEHGRGGLGTVSRAHDKELGRDVAIKELISRGDVGELRFLREALITARLEHPGIVPVHEAGRWPDGTPFYVMKLVAGRSLRELIDERKTVEARLELLLIHAGNRDEDNRSQYPIGVVPRRWTTAAWSDSPATRHEQ